MTPAVADAGMAYRVLHDTCYAYSDPVTSAHQLAHLKPRNTSWQTLRSHRIDIDPAPGERFESEDYFGNSILRFALDTPHDELMVRAQSVVEVRPNAPHPDALSPAWESALAPAGVWRPDVDLEVEQYRLASPMVPLLVESMGYARESFTPRRPWLAAMIELTKRIRADFVYDAKATTVATQVIEVFEHRHGVCQDFAHFMISCLRTLGLSARYVSGYVLNRPSPGKERLAGADASHAWVACYCPGPGWVAFDPTNGKMADLEFVTLGWGRDFSDVTPLRGVVLGAATQELSVAVNVEAL